MNKPRFTLQDATAAAARWFRSGSPEREAEVTVARTVQPSRGNPFWVRPLGLPWDEQVAHLDLISLTLAAHGFCDAALCAAFIDDAGLIRPHEAACIARLATPTADGSGAEVRTSPVPLADHVARALAMLGTCTAQQLQQEVSRQGRDTVSAIVIHAVQRALANHLAVSPAVVDRLGELHAAGIGHDFLLTKADPQAVGFMVDVLGMLRAVLLPRLVGARLSVLDLGAKSGAGSALAACLGQAASYAKLKFDVTCADIDPTYRDYSLARHPLVEYLNADAFVAGRRWDIVICSHVIEHVPDPLAFVQRLRTIATRFVVLAFPYMEDPNALIPGHLHSLGHDFLRHIRPERYEIYEGMFWSQSLCCIAVLDMEA